MIRLFPRLRGRVLLIALSLLAAPDAVAKQVTFTSASPYQLADLLTTAKPTYDLEISADLVYPDKIGERMPAFVFMHGSSGRQFHHHRYLELARELGFVSLQLDSFGPRGIGSTVGNQTNVTAAMMTADLLRALKFLATLPNVDPNKIVVMGSSKGAVAALYAAWNPIREKIAGGLDYAAYLLLYPLCTRIEDGKVTANAVRVFIGELDNWTPPAPCIAQASRMKALGRDWAITLYEGAYHGFDAPIEGIRNIPYAYGMAGCRVALRADGYEYETGSRYLLTRAERGKAFRACAKKGDVKIGGYHAADALLKDIGAFLETVSD
ncbi:MAG: dienelactone hydrolase family protein [Proteobacteria bacterium]|nr:dienelactone hydrolase family protein [Pseudomonadota bacterium]